MSQKVRVLEKGQCEITQGYNSNHHAVDIVGSGYTLDYVIAHSDGRIVFYQDGHNNAKGSTGNASYGNCVKIDHGNGYCTLYAHMQKGLLVSNGVTVKKGQRLGYMGNSGNSYGGHLHFEVWKDGVRINSTEYLNKDFVEPIDLPIPVERNNDLEQLQVIETQLRCRTGHSTNDTIIGFCPVGIYNIISMYKDEIYNWYEIENGKWVASEETWAIVLKPVKKEELAQTENKENSEEKDSVEEIIPPKEETNEKQEENDATIDYYERIEENNPLLWIIEKIVELIRKIFK